MSPGQSSDSWTRSGFLIMNSRLRIRDLRLDFLNRTIVGFELTVNKSSRFSCRSNKVVLSC